MELRAELEARNLPCKGLKSQLQAKLSKVLKQEMEADEEKEANEEKMETDGKEDDAPKPDAAEENSEAKKEESKQVGWHVLNIDGYSSFWERWDNSAGILQQYKARLGKSSITSTLYVGDGRLP